MAVLVYGRPRPYRMRVSGFYVGGVEIEVGEGRMREIAFAEGIDQLVMPLQILDTSDLEIPAFTPIASTSLSTLRVETPLL